MGWRRTWRRKDLFYSCDPRVCSPVSRRVTHGSGDRCNRLTCVRLAQVGCADREEADEEQVVGRE
jgi:hypothetical protein